MRLAIVVCLLAWSIGLPAAEGDFQEQVLQVRINGSTADEMLMVLHDGSGGYWIEAADFPRLHVLPPTIVPVEFDGRTFYPVNGIAGARVSLDPAQGLLEIELPASAFELQRLNAPPPGSSLPITSGKGLFLNYDVYAQNSGNTTWGSAYAELGLFSGFGVLTSTSVSHTARATARHVRLDTTFTRDFPDSLQTLTVGDSFTDPGTWGSALRYGGVAFARNFGIRPDLVTTPLLSAGGSAEVPSSIDVYINNQKVLSQDVQAGPFSIGNLPAISGSGDVSVLIRDAMGREVVLSQAFYSSPSLLAKGLTQYSVSAGSLRQNYTLSSFDYGDFLVSGTLRRGMTDRVTLAGHMEYLANGPRAAGLDLVTLLGNLGVGLVTVAAGGDAGNNGVLGGLGFEHRGPRAGFALLAQYASDGFRRTGDLGDPAYLNRFRGIAQASWTFGRAGSTSLAYAHRTYQASPPEQTISLGHSVQLRNVAASLSLSRLTGPNPQTIGYLSFSMGIGGPRSFEAAAESVRSDAYSYDDFRATAMQSAPAGVGQGWRVSASTRGNYDLWLQQRLPAADLEVRAARNDGASGQSLQARGSVALLGGALRASRTIDRSFAVVDIAGIPDVPVYLENQLVAHTDDRGQALLPSLLSYDVNRITIEPQDLPLNTAIGSREMEIRPAFRSGVLARFPVERTFPATFRLVQESGEPVPAGSRVTLNGAESITGLQGATYVTALDRPYAGFAEWQGGRCEFQVQPQVDDDPLPDLGVIPCFATLSQQR